MDLREVVEAISTCGTGCQWRALPVEFPPRSTVQGYFYAGATADVWQRITGPGAAARRALGRKPTPSAGSSTARARRRPRPAVRAASMPASASRDANATSSPTPGLAARRPGAPGQHSGRHGAVPLIVSDPLPRAAARLRRPRLPRRSAGTMRSPIAALGQIEIVKRRPVSKASSCCRGDGSSSEVSPGSAAAGALPRTSRQPSRAHRLAPPRQSQAAHPMARKPPINRLSAF